MIGGADGRQTRQHMYSRRRSHEYAASLMRNSGAGLTIRSMKDLYAKIRKLDASTLDWIIAIGLTLVVWVLIYLQPYLTGPGHIFVRISPSGYTVFGEQMIPGPLAYLLAAAALLPLGLRRKHPLGVLVVVTLAAATYGLFPGKDPQSYLIIGPLIAMFTLATMSRRWIIVAGALGSAVLMVLSSSPGIGDNRFWLNLISNFAMFGAVAAAGQAVRNQRAYVAEVELRAAEAERNREEETRRRVDEERLRIARELHDVTAHSLSVIAVQSGAAAHVIDENPAEARRALDAIRQTSKSALDELRAMLRVMRDAGDPGVPLMPIPGLSRIRDLTAPLTTAGLNVVTNIDGDLLDVPSVVDFSAYRIIQEALTNVMRHAGPCTVWVKLRRDDRGLYLEVADDGVTPEAGTVSGGHGLEGMGERVAALGGTFEAGPREAGGFRVMAYLPIEGGA